jgi:hypothetical protein
VVGHVFVSYCATLSVGLNLVQAASDAVPLTEVMVRCTTEMIYTLMQDQDMIRLSLELMAILQVWVSL